jgi:TIR domain
MDYQFDVFLSYLRQKPCDGWVRDHFLPYFQFQLGNALNRPLTIFVDTDEIHVGQKWPNRLREALAHSRCLVGIWTPLYFHSKWCRIESAIFAHREKQLGIGQNDDSDGLIAGIKVNDGIHFPEFAKESQYADFERYFFDGPGFTKSERYVEFQEAIPPLCTDVARIIDNVPAWSEEWCTKAWIDDVIATLDAVPPADVPQPLLG